jgi:hypothetical protein
MNADRAAKIVEDEDGACEVTVDHACDSDEKTTSSCDCSDGDSDDDGDWEKMAEAIKARGEARRSPSHLTVRNTQVLDIDDFFGPQDDRDEDFGLQIAICRSLAPEDEAIATASLKGSAYDSSEEASPFATSDVDYPMAAGGGPVASSSSSSSSRCHAAILVASPAAMSVILPRKYHEPPHSGITCVYGLSDELLSRILGHLERDGEWVCKRWKSIRLTIARTKTVDALASASGLPRDLVIVIETELFRLHNNDLSRQYKMKARSLISNLKANADLKGRVATGGLSAHALVRMSSQAMATKDLAQKREGQ